jgi:colanic acid/amylovoran biosynthesis glycosyltransferase
MKGSLVKLGCPEQKIIIQHLGIDLNKIKFMKRVPDKDGKIKILIAGRFCEKKGIPYGIEAIGRLKKDFGNIQITIIGGPDSSIEGKKEEKKILDMIDKYNLHENVKMMGYQPQHVFLRELYKNHILISPSIHAASGDSEGGAPVSIIEASASGMPVISTHHCDIPEVIIDKKTGYLVPERDVDALKERLKFLISHPEIWIKMGKEGRTHIQKNYNAMIQVEKLEQVYDLALKGKKS